MTEKVLEDGEDDVVHEVEKAPDEDDSVSSYDSAFPPPRRSFPATRSVDRRRLRGSQTSIARSQPPRVQLIS